MSLPGSHEVILTQLSLAINNVLKRLYANKETNSEVINIPEGDLEAISLCDAIEAVMVHDLRYGMYLVEFVEVLERMTSNRLPKRSVVFAALRGLSNVKTKVGLGRAWVRICLNEGVFDDYLRVLTSRPEHLTKFFGDTAALRNPEQTSLFVSLLLSIKPLSFHFNPDNAELDPVEKRDVDYQKKKKHSHMPAGGKAEKKRKRKKKRPARQKGKINVAEIVAPHEDGLWAEGSMIPELPDNPWAAPQPAQAPDPGAEETKAKGVSQKPRNRRAKPAGESRRKPEAIASEERLPEVSDASAAAAQAQAKEDLERKNTFTRYYESMRHTKLGSTSDVQKVVEAPVEKVAPPEPSEESPDKVLNRKLRPGSFFLKPPEEDPDRVVRKSVEYVSTPVVENLSVIDASPAPTKESAISNEEDKPSSEVPPAAKEDLTEKLASLDVNTSPAGPDTQQDDEASSKGADSEGEQGAESATHEDSALETKESLTQQVENDLEKAKEAKPAFAGFKGSVVDSWSRMMDDSGPYEEPLSDVEDPADDLQTYGLNVDSQGHDSSAKHDQQTPGVNVSTLDVYTWPEEMAGDDEGGQDGTQDLGISELPSVADVYASSTMEKEELPKSKLPVLSGVDEEAGTDDSEKHPSPTIDVSAMEQWKVDHGLVSNRVLAAAQRGPSPHVIDVLDAAVPDGEAAAESDGGQEPVAKTRLDFEADVAEKSDSAADAASIENLSDSEKADLSPFRLSRASESPLDKAGAPKGTAVAQSASSSPRERVRPPTPPPPRASPVYSGSQVRIEDDDSDDGAEEAELELGEEDDALEAGEAAFAAEDDGSAPLFTAARMAGEGSGHFRPRSSTKSPHVALITPLDDDISELSDMEFDHLRPMDGIGDTLQPFSALDTNLGDTDADVGDIDRDGVGSSIEGMPFWSMVNERPRANTHGGRVVSIDDRATDSSDGEEEEEVASVADDVAKVTDVAVIEDISPTKEDVVSENEASFQDLDSHGSEHEIQIQPIDVTVDSVVEDTPLAASPVGESERPEDEGTHQLPPVPQKAFRRRYLPAVKAHVPVATLKPVPWASPKPSAGHRRALSGPENEETSSDSLSADDSGIPSMSPASNKSDKPAFAGMPLASALPSHSHEQLARLRASTVIGGQSADLRKILREAEEKAGNSPNDAVKKGIPLTSFIVDERYFSDLRFTPRVDASSSLHANRLNAYILNITRPTTLEMQGNKCYGCQAPLPPGLHDRYRLCEYFGRFFCTRCHRNEEHIIPAKVLHEWDFTKGKVSNAAVRCIEEKLVLPTIDLSALNVGLYARVKRLRSVRNYRVRLSHMNDYIVTCSQSVQLLGLLAERKHFLSNPDIYTLSDLIMMQKKKLLPWVKNVVSKLETHILKKCEECRMKGRLCGICQQKPVVYAFQTEECFPCANGFCRNLLHRQCMVKTRQRMCVRCLMKT